MRRKRQIFPLKRLVLGLFIMIPNIGQAQEESLLVADTSIEEDRAAQEVSLTLSGEPLTLLKVAHITLENSSSIKIAEQTVKMAWMGYTGYLGEQREFDTNLILSANTTNTKYSEAYAKYFKQHYYSDVNNENARNLTATVSKLFRSGITGSLSVSTYRSDLLEMQNDASNSATTTLSLTFPLLKGRSSKSAAAMETAARFRAKGADFKFFHQASQVLLEAITAYWNYKAAVVRLKVQQEAEQTVQEWTAEASAGVQQQGNNVSQYQTEATRLEAYLNYKRKNVLAASEEVNTTRGELARVMGVSFEQIDNIGEPSDDFPQNWANVLKEIESKPIMINWINVALQHRFDLKAAKQEVKASEAQLGQAEIDIMPQLDLGLSYSFNGEERGDAFSYHIDAIHSDTHQSATGANLMFYYPLENSKARSVLADARAVLQMSTLSMKDSERQVGIDVSVATETVLGRLRTAVEAKKSIESYATVGTKISKISLKDNPRAILDYINFEKQINEAYASPASEENSYINSIRDLAIAITELRHNTGTLVVGGEVGKNIELSSLTTLPSVNSTTHELETQELEKRLTSPVD